MKSSSFLVYPAQQSRQKFLDLYALNKEDLPDDGQYIEWYISIYLFLPFSLKVSTTLSDAGTVSTVTGGGVAVPQFSPIPLKPFDFSQYYM